MYGTTNIPVNVFLTVFTVFFCPRSPRASTEPSKYSLRDVEPKTPTRRDSRRETLKDRSGKLEVGSGRKLQRISCRKFACCTVEKLHSPKLTYPLQMMVSKSGISLSRGLFSEFFLKDVLSSARKHKKNVDCLTARFLHSLLLSMKFVLHLRCLKVEGNKRCESGIMID